MGKGEMVMADFAPYIDEHGIQMPTYEERLTELIRAYQEIYGNEVVLDESTPDYQLLSVFARALDDTSALVVQDYNSRNVDYATGQSLDLLAAGYGVERRVLQSGTESDANLRARVKGAMASLGCADVCALEAALRGLEYVQDVRIYVNDGDSASAEGFPGHSLACVVYSGRNQQIAETIWDKKAPGVGTYGTTSYNVMDENGVSHAVQFSRPVTTLITIVIRIRHLNGYDASVEDTVDMINGILVPVIEMLKEDEEEGRAGELKKEKDGRAGERTPRSVEGNGARLELIPDPIEKDIGGVKGYEGKTFEYVNFLLGQFKGAIGRFFQKSGR